MARTHAARGPGAGASVFSARGTRGIPVLPPAPPCQGKQPLPGPVCLPWPRPQRASTAAARPGAVGTFAPRPGSPRGQHPDVPPHPLELPKNPWRTPTARVRVGGYRQRRKERRAVPTVTARGYGTLPDPPMQPLCLGLIQMPVENSRLLPLPRRSTQGPPPAPCARAVLRPCGAHGASGIQHRAVPRFPPAGFSPSGTKHPGNAVSLPSG